MKKYSFSCATGGFYHGDVHGAAVPADAIAITDAHYRDLAEGLRRGERIRADAAGQMELYVAPLVVPVLSLVSMRQFRKALRGAGLLGAAENALAGLLGDVGDDARIDWATLTVVRRDSDLVALLGEALSLDSDAIERMFLARSNI